MDWILWAVLAILSLMIARRLLKNWLIRTYRRQMFKKEYLTILTDPKYKVRGNFEE